MPVGKLGGRDHKARHAVLLVESVVSPVRDIARDRVNQENMTDIYEDIGLVFKTRSKTTSGYSEANPDGNKVG
jgi:hypothetical protein